ncbi:MAG: YbaN family protein [Nanoarchaeota archaeon]|nr:YbaN family protein [Nanoarchaeota archaeon]
MINPIRSALIVLGSFFLVIGLLALLIPILPTFPFVLLAGLCYLKSSKSFFNWLINNRFSGRYLNKYVQKSPGSDDTVLCIAWPRLIVFYSVIILFSSAISTFIWFYI